MSLHRQLDWVAKHRLLEAYRERDGLDWGDPKLRAIDLQYHDVRRDKGLYYRLEATGRSTGSTTDAEVDLAVMEPPRTRVPTSEAVASASIPTRSPRRRGTL